MVLPIAAVLAVLVVQDSVIYDVTFQNAVHHEAQIEVTFSGVSADPLEVRMSRSSPGRYALHEFAKNVYAVGAYDGRGRELEVTRPDPYQWNVSGHDGTVRIRYTLYADRADGTYSGIDETHAHLNMPATFIWARGQDERPIRVTFRPPPGSGWKAATQLVPTDDDLTFEAPNLYYFFDSPTELSDFALREWKVSTDERDYTLRLAVHHAGSDADVDACLEMVRLVVDEAAAVFGGFPEFDHGTYTFIADYLPYVFGDGMEHRNSTILVSRMNLAAGARRLLGTVSHEFIHAWNVERIRPRSLEPFDFERANMSGELWFGEGFTSYYDDILIRRAGLMDDERFAQVTSGTLNFVINAPGRRFFSPVEMSMQAPFVDAATSIDPTNRANTFISYYTWGAALGLGLDLTLRTRFDDLNLDDFMRAVWRRHGATEVPYTVADLETVLGEVTGNRAFATEFFDRYIRGRDVVDYAPLLASAGFVLRQSNPGEAILGWAQLRYGDRGGEVRSNTLIGTPLYEAGVERGDRILRLDGRRIRSAEDLQIVLAAHRPGDEVEIEFEGRTGTRSARMTLYENPNFELVSYEAAGLALTPEIEAFRERWLGSKAR